VRSLILEVALVGFAAGTLIAQVPTTYGELGMPRGGVRLKDIEEGMPPLANGDTRFVRAYRFNTTAEMMFGHFRGVLGGTRDLDVAQDSSTLEPGETTPVSYRLDFHSFDDVCREADGTLTEPTPGCKTLLRGNTKRSAFNHSGRIPYPAASGEDVWLERGTFSWVVRNPDGAWVHWEVAVIDDGLAKDWKHHEPYSRILVQQIVHRKPAPQPVAAPAQEPTSAQAAPAAQDSAAVEDGAIGAPAAAQPAAPAQASPPPAGDSLPDLRPAPKDSTPSR